MKTNGTRLLVIVLFVQLLILLFSFSIKAQPDYVFKNPVLISGTDLTIGAKYRFNNVKPGFDGIISIVDMTGSMTLDRLDGGSGFDEAFQPYINCEPKKKGYVEFVLEFVNAGTTTLAKQFEVPLTAIDIDGYEYPDDKLYEMDAFQESPSMYVNYDLLGTSLEVKKSGIWYEAVNKSAITYPGIDTLQKDVMFTAVHANISSIRFRVGADNRSNEFETRLRSVYFKKFIYTSSFLAKSPLLSFNGLEKNKKVELRWVLEKNSNLQAAFIEKSTAGSSFKQIGMVSVSPESATQTNAVFLDNELLTGNSLYRLKMIGVNGISQYSNILSFRFNEQARASFKIYPSTIQSNATISIAAEKPGTASVEVIDYAGRIVNRQQVTVQEGNNNLPLNNISAVLSGNYLVVLKMDNNTYTQKIIKQ